MTFVGLPLRIPNLTKIYNVSPGYLHCLALDQHGRVLSAGSNKYGELGRSSGRYDQFCFIKRPINAEGQKLFINMISAGNKVSFIFAEDGKLYSFGCKRLSLQS